MEGYTIMQSPSQLKFAPRMLTYKENLKQLIEFTKELEDQLGDSLQQTLLKSSNIVKLNKNIKELELLLQTVENMDSIRNDKTREELLATMRKRLFENQCLIIDDIQKSMLKAAEALVDAGNGITILTSFVNMNKTLENFEKMVKGT